MDAASHPALLLVDGVSSIGALDFQFDKWRVDVAVTGSQKALSIPTGLAMVCVSDKVRRARRGHSWDSCTAWRPLRRGAARPSWTAGRGRTLR